MGIKKTNSHFEFLLNRKKVNSKRSQISFEYLIIMGFITFVITGVLAIAIFYGGGIRDRIKITQMANCANKIISTAESVFYAGPPSRATITCYLPDGIQNFEIDNNKKDLIFTLQISTGRSTTDFTSNVEIRNETSVVMTQLSSPGSKKIRLEAYEEPGTGNSWIYMNKA